MGSCSPSHGGDVVGDGVLVEVGGTVVPLARMLDSPGERMILIVWFNWFSHSNVFHLVTTTTNKSSQVRVRERERER